jgi:sterol O-acyltransferase
MYVVVEEYILPVVLNIGSLKRTTNMIEYLISTTYVYSKLLLPCNAFFLLGFFFVFEYWCNLFAELTCFADRQFYTDWWNGVSFYDFSTRWNIPVHKFLQKYIYRHLIEEYKMAKGTAMIVTFLFSSVFHELVMFVMMGPSKYMFTFLFVYQMLQLPLISLVVGTGWAKRNVNLANWVFWIMLVLGIPTVVLSYALFSI